MLAVAVSGIFFLMGNLTAEEQSDKTAVSPATSKAEESQPKKDDSVCADCAKLNKNLKAGEDAKLCPECQKKAFVAKPAPSAPSSTKTPSSAPSAAKPAVKAEDAVCH